MSLVLRLHVTQPDMDAAHAEVLVETLPAGLATEGAELGFTATVEVVVGRVLVFTVRGDEEALHAFAYRYMLQHLTASSEEARPPPSFSVTVTAADVFDKADEDAKVPTA